MSLLPRLLPLLPLAALCFVSLGMRIAHHAVGTASARDAVITMPEAAGPPKLILFPSSERWTHGLEQKVKVRPLLIIDVHAGEKGRQMIFLSNRVTARVINAAGERFYAGEAVAVGMLPSPPKSPHAAPVKDQWYAVLAAVPRP